jgi:hypothetical protein
VCTCEISLSDDLTGHVKIVLYITGMCANTRIIYFITFITPKGVLKNYSMFAQIPLMYRTSLICPVKSSRSEISQVHTKHQARYSVLCINTHEHGPLGPKHVVGH